MNAEDFVPTSSSSFSSKAFGYLFYDTTYIDSNEGMDTEPDDSDKENTAPALFVPETPKTTRVALNIADLVASISVPHQTPTPGSALASGEGVSHLHRIQFSPRSIKRTSDYVSKSQQTPLSTGQIANRFDLIRHIFQSVEFNKEPRISSAIETNFSASDLENYPEPSMQQTPSREEETELSTGTSSLSMALLSVPQLLR